jgi:hypothetical protein
MSTKPTQWPKAWQGVVIDPAASADDSAARGRMLRVLAERASAALQIERTLRAWRRRAG